jgi:hypothetical protein
MNWDAIGAVGELISALAVVITLAYLASQVRYAKAATNDANRLVRASGVREMMLAGATNNELRESQIRGYRTESFYESYAEALGISAEDAARVDYGNAYYFWLHWGQFASSKSLVDTDELRHLVDVFYRRPAVRYSWENSPWGKVIFESAFVSFVDDVLSK